jgi:hypothetical protein
MKRKAEDQQLLALRRKEARHMYKENRAAFHASGAKLDKISGVVHPPGLLDMENWDCSEAELERAIEDLYWNNGLYVFISQIRKFGN